MPPPEADPREARLELARRYLHVFGPTTPAAFAQWASIAPAGASAAFEALGGSLEAVRTPIGDAWIVSNDEPTFRAPPRPTAAARLLPSGDTYYLLHGRDRELLVMRYLEQLSTKEIAAALGSTEGAIKTRHVRALERLRGLLDNALGDD